jgi:hypothetical protein
VQERGGFDLLPEMGYKPVNKYLPPRPRRDATTADNDPIARVPAEPLAHDGSVIERFFAFADKMLSR